jgi:hypothetical protein
LLTSNTRPLLIPFAPVPPPSTKLPSGGKGRKSSYQLLAHSSTTCSLSRPGAVDTGTQLFPPLFLSYTPLPGHS